MVKKPSVAGANEGRVTLVPSDLRLATIAIRGETPLIVHQWAEKAKQEMRDKHGKKPKRAREMRDPVAEYEAATYYISRSPDRYGFPALGFKMAMVDAAVSKNVKMTQVKRAFHVIPDARLVDGKPLVEILTDEPPFMREDPVRVGLGSADLRYRPQFNHWRAHIKLHYDAGQFSIDQLVNIVNQAGFSTGIGDWRTQKNGESGQFVVEKVLSQ